MLEGMRVTPFDRSSNKISFMKHKASLIALFDALIVLEIHFKLNPFFVVASKAEKKNK